jgi:diguanylate cyclase (GGDEF)-like protein/PAS domain S-box-containing protein
MRRGRRAIGAILLTFALSSAVTVAVTIRATSKAQHRASVIEVAGRQRTLAERYVRDILLVRQGAQADPAVTGETLRRSAAVLLDGGTVPAVDGDDDEAELPPTTDADVRAQLEQQRRLVADLTATGSGLARRPVAAVPPTAGERLDATDPLTRLRVLAALTSNVALDASRTLAAEADRGVSDLIRLQVGLGGAGLVMSLLLAFALIRAARRQTAHFRSLVTNSTDFVFVLGASGWQYASRSVGAMVGRPESELLGDGLWAHIHEDDRESVRTAADGEIVVRLRNRFGEWRELEAHVSDLRADRLVRGVVLNARDIGERLRLEEQLTRQAFHDGLTGLANRALFRDRLDQALARSERSRDALAVLLIDLDSFKQVNDSLGHDAGDDLLQQLAERFAAMVRPSDTLARLGGDEFALLLEGVTKAQAVAVAGRLLEQAAEPVRIAGRELALSASIGVVVHPGGSGDSAELIRHADVAMYAAKETGPGRLEVFRYEMAREVGELLGMEHELRLALQRDEFVVHYQPEVALDTGAIVGAEALVRWQSPTRGTVPPGQFVPLAEASGLIVAIGEHVLREACQQAAQWSREGLLSERFVTWVNVSAKQLAGAGLADVVEDALTAAGLAPERLGLEVTETAIVEQGEAAERARIELERLHDLGVRIAIDDFGTGFSSLGQLRHFPIDVLKVDRSFVHGVEHDAKDAAIAANLVSLAHALGLVAIAEGIESDGQLDAFRELGCDEAQGFLFARPGPPEALTALLAGTAEVARHPLA